MNPIDELTRQEIREAVTLAQELRDRDALHSARRSAALELEQDVPSLLQAVSIVKTRKLATRQQAIKLRIIVAAVVVFLLLAGDAVLLPLLHRRSQTNNSSAPPTTDTAALPTPAEKIVLPIPGDTQLSGLPVDSDQIENIQGYDSGDASSVTFVNLRKDEVVLNWIGDDHKFMPYFKVPPGSSKWVPAEFNVPILATKTNGAIIALYYPPALPTTAMLTETTGTHKDSLLQGYLESAAASTFPSQVRVATQLQQKNNSKLDRVSANWMSILNLTRDSINAYELNPDGSATFIQTLRTGELFAGGTDMADRWLVTDRHQHVLGLYATPAVDRVAAVLPIDYFHRAIPLPVPVLPMTQPLVQPSQPTAKPESRPDKSTPSNPSPQKNDARSSTSKSSNEANQPNTPASRPVASERPNGSKPESPSSSHPTNPDAKSLQNTVPAKPGSGSKPLVNDGRHSRLNELQHKSTLGKTSLHVHTKARINTPLKSPIK